MARSMTSSIASHREPLLHLLTPALLLHQLSCSLGVAQSSDLPVPCEPEQASALLRLKGSFPFGNRSTCVLGACGELEKSASLDAAAFSVVLPWLRHVNRSCNDFDVSSKLPPQQEGLEGLTQLPIHYYMDRYIKQEEERSHKWLTTLLWALLTLGLYPVTR